MFIHITNRSNQKSARRHTQVADLGTQAAVTTVPIYELDSLAIHTLH